MKVDIVAPRPDAPSRLDEDMKMITDGLRYCDDLIIRIDHTSAPIAEYHLFTKPLRDEAYAFADRTDTWVGATAHSVALRLADYIYQSIKRGIDLVDDWHSFRNAVLHRAERVELEFERFTHRMFREHILVGTVHGRPTGRLGQQKDQSRRRNSRKYTTTLVMTAIVLKMEEPGRTESECAKLAGIPVTTLNGHALWNDWRRKIEDASTPAMRQRVKSEFDRRTSDFLSVDPSSEIDADTGRRFT